MQDMDELKSRLDKIEQSLSKIEGGWKAFIFIAGVGSAFVSWVVTHWIK